MQINLQRAETSLTLVVNIAACDACIISMGLTCQLISTLGTSVEAQPAFEADSERHSAGEGVEEVLFQVSEESLSEKRTQKPTGQLLKQSRPEAL